MTPTQLVYLFSLLTVLRRRRAVYGLVSIAAALTPIAGCLVLRGLVLLP